MILIITHKEDYTADFLINKLNLKGISYKRFNCEDLPKTEYYIDNEINAYFDHQSAFTSVWFRRTKLPEIEADPAVREYLLVEYDALLKNLFNIIAAKWVSEPYHIYKAENKLFQLKTAKEIGWAVPKTLVTNSKNRLRNFYLENKKNIIIKPLAQSKIAAGNENLFLFTNLVKEEHIDSIDTYDLTPCIFQEKIEKSLELRVTVVGNKAFTAAVDSTLSEESRIDWRKGHLPFFKYALPSEIETKCILLVKKLNLRFGAIDIIKNTDGQYIFLEINPNGQWAWIEQETGMPISEAIINELL